MKIIIELPGDEVEERTNKYAGERQLDKHKCESADCEGCRCLMMLMMMSCGWEEEVDYNNTAHPHVSSSHTVHSLTSTYAIARAFICVCVGTTMEKGTRNWERGTGCRPGSGPKVSYAGRCCCCCCVAFFRVTFTDRKRKLNA